MNSIKTIFFLALGCVFSSINAQVELLSPIRVNNDITPTLIQKTGANTFDSTFIYTTDTLSLPLFDEFSKNNFQTYSTDYSAPNVTEEKFYVLLDVANNPLPANSIFSTVETFKNELDLTTGETMQTPLPSIDIKIGNFTNYPPVYTTTTVYPPYTIWDTINPSNPSDTIFSTTDLVTQDSAIQFFVQLNDPSKFWLDSKAYHNYRFAVNPWSLGVVTFDGLDENGFPYAFGTGATGYADFLTSKPLRMNGLLPSDSIYFSFLYQKEGFGDIPEESDSLVVEFFAPDLNQWFRVWSVNGGGVSDFKIVHFPIKDPKYLKKGFQFRFKNYGGLSGSLDHFHIDYVHLRRLSGYQDTLFKDFAFVYPIGSLLKDYTAVPWDHYKNNSTGKMSDAVRITVRNGSNIQENSQNGIVNVSYNGTPEGSFVLSNFILTNQDPGQNYAPRTVYESFHDFSSGYEYDPTKPGLMEEFQVSSTVSAQFPNLTQNDSSFAVQSFKNYYAYDDGSAEQAYGITGIQARLAYQFTPYEADSLIGVMMHFAPTVNDVSNKLFLLTVWNDNGGVPGQVLYEDEFFYPREPEYAFGRNEFVTYFLKDTVKLPITGTFYVGWRQIDPDRLNIGFDRNLDNSDKLFYSLNNGVSWTNSQLAGSIMMRPLFSTGLDATLNLPENPPLEVLEWNVFPNPTTGSIAIQRNFPSENGYILFSMDGKQIGNFDSTTESIDMTHQAPGLYLLKELDSGKTLKISKK